MTLCISASATRWSAFQSEHISLLTDNGKNGQEILVELENARRTLSALGLPVVAQPKPMTLILTSKQSELREVWPTVPGESGTVGGLTYVFEDRIFVILDMSRPEADKNLLHEYVHALVGERFVALPRWLDEGIAEHYSTLTLHDGQVFLGPLDARRRWIQGACPQPGSFRQILSVEPGSFIAKKGSGAFYLSSAVTVRFLIEEYGIRQLYRMIDVFQQGTSMENAVSRIYGKNIDEIGSESLVACTARLTPREHATVSTLTFSSGSLPDAERQFSYTHADLLARLTGHQDQAIYQFEELLRANPNDAVAKRGLGIALVYKKDFEKAAMLLQDSLKAFPADSTTLYHLLIACTNSVVCNPDDYAGDVRALLPSHPYLSRVNEWIEALDRAERQDDVDSPYLPDEKTEIAVKKK